MDNNRLIKLAKKLVDLIPFAETPTDVYVSLLSIAKNQKEYFFDMLGYDNFVKLSIILWFKKIDKEGNYDDLFNKLEFITLFSHRDEESFSECTKCDGTGEETCSHCNGTGTNYCNYCAGAGEIECVNCDGTGYDDDNDPCILCRGKGVKDCRNCDDGTEDCKNCRGFGTKTCSSCDGIGEIVSDNKIYYVTQIISWDSNLNEKSKEKKGTKKFLISEDSLSNNFSHITIAQVPDETEIPDDFKSDYFYVLNVQDSPNFYLSQKGRIMWRDPSNLIRNLLDVE